VKLLRLVCLALPVFALSADASSIALGTASSYGVLGATTVTNVPALGTVINGDLGLWPGTSITGFPPGVVNGTTNNGNAAAQQAQADALTAYGVLAGLPVTADLTGLVLGNLGTVPLLDSGVYFFSSSAQPTGQLTLDFQGLNNALVAFQIGSTLTTASGSSVLIINPGTHDEVFWQIGSSATLGTGTALYGSVIAQDSITLNTLATIDCGRAIALTGAVTMDDNTVSTGNCVGGTGTTPEPATLTLVSTGAAAAGAAAWDSTFAGLGLAGAFAAIRRKIRR